MLLMTAVVALYTICSLNDKYAVSKAKFNGSQLTFLMAAGTVPFLALLLPFSDRTFTLSPITFIFIILIAACKYFEFCYGSGIGQKKGGLLKDSYPSYSIHSSKIRVRLYNESRRKAHILNDDPVFRADNSCGSIDPVR